MRVVGIENLNYVNKNGEQVQAHRLHLVYDKQNCEGVACLSEFISSGVNCNVKIDDIVELLYNKFGKVSYINIITD